MYYISYNRLTDVTKTVKPYRGSTNRYPISSRTHNNKCFYAEKEGDDTVYKITYGMTYREYPVTKEEYLNSQVTGVGGYQEISWRPDDAPDKYVRYERQPRELGIVRPDNSFEFTGQHFYQGENMIMSSWSRGYFHRSSRHGGMVYSGFREEVFHPIFRGLKVNCDTMQALTPYELKGKRVMRKVAKDFLKQYVDFYKVSEAMMKSMRLEDFIGIGEDLAKELGITKSSWGSYEVDSEFLHHEAQARLHTAPMDSAVLYCMAHNIYHMAHRVAFNGQNSYYTRQDVDLLAVYQTMKNRLNREIYRNNPQVFKEVEYESGKKYPASEWGVTVLVDGKEVEQF